MPIYLIQGHTSRAEQGRLEAALRAKIPDLMEASSLDAVTKSAETTAIDDPIMAIVVLPPGGRNNFDQFIDFAARHHNDIFLIFIGDEISASEYKRLVHSGTAEWVSANSDLGEVLDIVARRRSREKSVASSRTFGYRPVSISFVPSAGGVGNTTLALEVAAYIKTDKATRERSICVVDLDFQTSHVCDYLDCEPRLQIADLSNAPERLDEQLFESFKTRHGSGIDVFAAPRSKVSPEAINIDALDALFTMIASRYNLVIIINPLPWFAWTSQIIAASDTAVVTGINTIPCLRQVSETVALVRTNGSTTMHVCVAVNRCERTLLGVIARRKHAEMVLRDEQVFFVGHRPEAVDSVNMGTPMLLGAAAGKVRRELAPLAKFCAGLQPTRPLVS